MKIEIEKIAFGGYGIGRVDGKIVFVDRVIPGELAEIEIIRDKRSYSKAKLIEVLKESEIREDPQCPVFDRCGGCQFQHIEYSEQLKIKQQTFTETLERLGRLKNLEILPIISSSRPYGYRSKIGLSIWFEHNSYSVGYHLEGSVEKLPIDRCRGYLTTSIIWNFLELMSSDCILLRTREYLLQQQVKTVQFWILLKSW